MNKKYLSVILFSALMVGTTGTFTSCKDYDDDIKNLQEQIDQKASLKDLEDKVAALQTDVNAAKTAAEEAKNKAQEALDKANASGNVTSEDLNALKADLQAQIDKLASLEKLAADLAALKQEIAGTYATQEALDALTQQVNSMTEQVASLIGKRLTSLVFAPTTYIDGIEAIKFATLRYTPWTNLLADKADGKTEITINDGTTKAEYFVSPSTVDPNSILSLGFIANTAENIVNTKSGEKAPISVASYTLKDGKLSLNLKKETTESFGGTETTKFTIVSLKAETQLSDEEVENGVDPNVYSDWARLYESYETPYIHYAAYDGDATLEDLKKDDAWSTPEGEKPATPDVNEDIIPHFYPYFKLHNADAADGVNNTDGCGIVLWIPYNKEGGTDLLPLVDVCDKEGVTYDAASYDLAFEFKAVDYYLQDGTHAEEKTNQAKFIKIEGSKIYATSLNGQLNNKDAIGREPLIQVVLKDTKNNKVVDVRYFKVKWTTANVVENLGTLKEFTADYSCGEVYDNTVLTEDMNNKIYTHINISKEDFHRLYELDKEVYASLEDAKAKKAASNLGTLEDVIADGSTTTHNLKWNFGIATNAVIQSEYEAGTATRTVYGVYRNVNDANDMYVFALVLKLNIPQMSLTKGYMQAYWNTTDLTAANINKTFQVNPALTSDPIYGQPTYTDCQIVGDIKDGYYTKPENVLELVKNADEAKFIFDADRVASILGEGWTVSEDGKTLSKGLITAATIDADGNIQLFEGENPGKNGNPTEAARALLGKDVPVKLAGTYCELYDVLDNFKVNFMNPLTLKIEQPEGAFHDLRTGGSSISVKGLATVTEAFGEKRVVLGEGAVAGLTDWYMVKDVTWDVKNATTNLAVKDGNLIISDDVTATPWSEITAIYEKMELAIDTDKQELTFNNASGTHLQQAYQIAIPVYVQTKWNPELVDGSKAYVIVDVLPD